MAAMKTGSRVAHLVSRCKHFVTFYLRPTTSFLRMNILLAIIEIWVPDPFNHGTSVVSVTISSVARDLHNHVEEKLWRLHFYWQSSDLR